MKWLAGMMVAGALWAQPLTISQVVKQAVEQYPSLKVNEEQIRAAAAGVTQARLAYLPKADAIAQVNRATRNNIYGMVLQQQVISPISGPPLNANAGTNVFGSAVGFLVSWEPFDFGLRRANVGVSEAGQKRAEAGLKRTRFEVATLAADAYLTLLAAEEALRAAEAGRERVRKIEPVVKSLVESGLRPGVDLSRTEAERVAAENQVIAAEGAVAIARTTLAQLIQAKAGEVAVARGKFFEMPAGIAVANVKDHPQAVEQGLAREESQARMRVIERSYYPKFNTQATMYARGTGARPDFTTGGWGSGLAPNIYNWGVGFTVTYSLMELPGLRVRKEIEAARGRGEQARYETLLRELETQRLKAETQVSTAGRIAANTPVAMKAAREARAQAEARYRAGLTSITDLADAERALTAAEIDDGLARLNVWRAQLALAVAGGDLTNYLDAAERP